jgi:hypothetical protein
MHKIVAMTLKYAEIVPECETTLMRTLELNPGPLAPKSDVFPQSWAKLKLTF